MSTGARYAIACYFIDVLEAPPPCEWGEHGGTVSIIMRELRLKEGNNRLVKRVLQDVMDCHAEVVLQAHQRIRKQAQ